MGRLLDEDDIKRALIECKGLGRKSCELVWDAIKGLPTAYDVREVIRQMELECFRMYDDNDVIDVIDAKRIIRKGGVNETT